MNIEELKTKAKDYNEKLSNFYNLFEQIEKDFYNYYESKDFLRCSKSVRYLDYIEIDISTINILLNNNSKFFDIHQLCFMIKLKYKDVDNYRYLVVIDRTDSNNISYFLFNSLNLKTKYSGEDRMSDTNLVNNINNNLNKAKDYIIENGNKYKSFTELLENLEY